MLFSTAKTAKIAVLFMPSPQGEGAELQRGE